MSSAHDAHGASAHAHDDHPAFDGEPAHELSPGEPRTPGWLPAVGLALFSCVAMYLLAGGDSAAAPPPPAPVKLQPAAAPVAAQPPPRRAAPDGTAAPAGSAMRKLTPDQIDQLKKRIEEARAKGGLPKPGAAPPGK